jgi:hypothetical protein
MTSAEIFAAGYAVPLYNISERTRHWRYESEEFTLPAGAVVLRSIPGVGFKVGRIEDVRKAVEEWARA